MHFYLRLILTCFVLVCLNGPSLARHRDEVATGDKDKDEKKDEKKDEDTNKNGKAGPYGIVATAKASNNRSCRATWCVA